MMWFVRPNNAEIDPKVKPVDIINVVYMPSRFSDAGKTALPRNHKAWRLATIDTLLNLGSGISIQKKRKLCDLGHLRALKRASMFSIGVGGVSL
jgi:hypothetical protein